MTVSTEIDSEQYTGNGITTTFPYRFRILQSANMVVTRIDLNDAETVLILGTDYTITGAGGYSGGNVILSSPLPNGFGLTLVRDLPITQETDLRNQGTFFAEVHEDAFDKLTMLIQQVFSRFSLALRRNTLLSKFYDAKGYRISNMADPVNTQDAATKNYVDSREAASLSKTLRVPEDFVAELPSAEDRANKVFTWDSQGAPKASVPVSGSAADVLIELAKPNGSSLVGYTNPQSGVVESVKVALDKINVRLVYAKDFGVKADGGDDTDALWALGQFISNATDPLYVIFPHGTSRCGSQEFAGATGKGFSYRPSYFSRPWGDAADRGWFSIHRTDNFITLDMTGWTLKLNDGMKQGSFDPMTGVVYNPASLPFINYDYQAGSGFMLKVYKAPNLQIFNGTLDGNLANASWGGNFGDHGYQVFSYNSWFNESQGVYVRKMKSINSVNDGYYVNENANPAPITDDIFTKQSVFEDIEAYDCGRNMISYTSGTLAKFIRPRAWRAGNNANGINGKGSRPMSCMDVESESGAISNLDIINPSFMFGGDKALDIHVAVGDINNVNVVGGMLHCESGVYAYYNDSRNASLENVKCYGGASFATGTLQNATSVKNCKFYNRINNRYINGFAVSGKVSRFDNNEIYYEIKPSTPIALPIIAISPVDSATGGYGSKSTCENLYINLSGVADNFQIDQIGGISFYRGASVHVDCSTSGKNLILYMTGSTSGLRGLSTNSPKFNFGGAMEKVAGLEVYYDLATNTEFGGMLTPSVNNIQTIGKRGMEPKSVYSVDGIYTRSPQGDLYRLSINNAGSPIVTLIP